MPFVRIDLASDFDDAAVRLIADGVHAALISTIGVPPADRFQVITRRKPGEMIFDQTYLDIDRSQRVVGVQITLSAGRDDEKKRALYAAIAANLAAGAVRPQDIFIVLTENDRANWSFGNGLAQYAPALDRVASAVPVHI